MPSYLNFVLEPPCSPKALISPVDPNILAGIRDLRSLTSLDLASCYKLASLPKSKSYHCTTHEPSMNHPCIPKVSVICLVCQALLDVQPLGVSISDVAQLRTICKMVIAPFTTFPTILSHGFVPSAGVKEQLESQGCQISGLPKK